MPRPSPKLEDEEKGKLLVGKECVRLCDDLDCGRVSHREVITSFFPHMYMPLHPSRDGLFLFPLNLSRP